MNSLQNVAPHFRFSVRRSVARVPKKEFKHVRGASAAVNITPTECSGGNKIVIPKRIERTPTDILKALSSTVKRDYLAPHYTYHDDPFLIPTSNMSKRVYALSQESGRKAAHWVRQEHSDLFQHRVADPPIEAYFPRAIFDENSNIDDETVLHKVISQHLVSDSLMIYNLLEKNNVDITRDTKQALLELLCYYNCEDPLEEEWIEERWFRQAAKSREKKFNTWKREGAADKLFKSMSPPDTVSYSAMICGKAQFGDVAGAFTLYQEAADGGLSLPVEVFNKLIVGSIILKEGHELRWQVVEEMLAAMKRQGTLPNLGTLNALLETLSSMSTNKNSQKYALSIIVEFKNMGIEPSLASYYFLSLIFCHNRGTMRSAILESIINILEGKSLTIKDPRDVLFFTDAMEICRFHLSDVDLAYRVDKLLHTADNYNLIGDSLKESIYYRNFFALICQCGALKEFMVLYDKLVPNIYVPEAGIMEEIIKTVDLNEASELLPRLWSDLVMFELVDKETLICAMLTALRRSNTSDETLVGQHADVAWAIWEKLENQKQNRLNRKISWTGQMLSDVMQVLLRADRYDQALIIVNCLDMRQDEILGVPTLESLNAFLDKAIVKKDIKNAIWCVQYCSEVGFVDIAKMAQKLSTSVDLNENDRNRLATIVGNDALHKPATSA